MEMISLFDYLGRKAGPDLGLQVATAAKIAAKPPPSVVVTTSGGGTTAGAAAGQLLNGQLH